MNSTQFNSTTRSLQGVHMKPEIITLLAALVEAEKINAKGGWYGRTNIFFESTWKGCYFYLKPYLEALSEEDLAKLETTIDNWWHHPNKKPDAEEGVKLIRETTNNEYDFGFTPKDLAWCVIKTFINE